MAIVRTRFSPSPTGKLHIGSLRTALYNFLYARQHQGQFLLRIEDTDQSRLVPGAKENIIANLAWATLPYDNEPMVQSQRLPRYHHVAHQLLTQGHAYACFCSPERLEAVRRQQQTRQAAIRYDGRCRQLSPRQITQLRETQPAHVLRLKLPQTGTMTFADLVRGSLTVACDTLDDQIIIKSDGFPTYHLAAVVDDHDMEITHVIRGEEWLPSTPKHLVLYQYLGWSPPAYAHLPLLLNPDRSKLSKRTNVVAVDDFRAAGYLPAALLNFVLLLGWNPGTTQEIFDRETMIKTFRLEKVNKSGAVFNQEKLNWINGWYLRHLSLDELVTHTLPYLRAAGYLDDGTDPDYVKKIVSLEQSRIKRLDELPALVEYFFHPPQLEAKLLAWKGQTTPAAQAKLGRLKNFLTKIPPDDFEHRRLEKLVKDWIVEQGWSNGEVLWPMRVALTGRQASPNPFEISAVLGQAATLKRLERAAGAAHPSHG